MRTASLLLLTLVAGTTLFAATNREATYVVGNLDSIHTGATGFVRVESDRLTFHTGKVAIETPYAKISGTELGPKSNHPVDVPVYKVWDLHKKFGNKTVYQNFTVNFKDNAGKEQTMTLELTEAAALEIHNTLDLRTGQKARRQQDEWWGDEYWRTNRNQKTWDTQTASLSNR